MEDFAKKVTAGVDRGKKRDAFLGYCKQTMDMEDSTPVILIALDQKNEAKFKSNGIKPEELVAFLEGCIRILKGGKSLQKLPN